MAEEKASQPAMALSDHDKESGGFEKPHIHEEKDTTTSSITADEVSNRVEKAENELAKPEAEVASDYPTGLKLVTLIIALCLAVFLVALDQTIIATAIPKITDRFNSISDIGWYGSAYFLTATSLQPTFGRVYKVFNVSVSLL